MNHQISKREIAHLLRTVNPQAIWATDKILCPFHDDHTPSLHVYEDGLYCFVCGAQASALKVLMAQGHSFPDAIDLLYTYRGKQPKKRERPVVVEPIPVERVMAWHEALLGSPDAMLYLANRGITREAVESLGLGWTDGRSYAIPHFVNGNVENVKFRVHPEFLMDDEAKYMSYAHRPFSQPYPYDVFMRIHQGTDRVFICEGEFDAIILLQEGFPTVSVPSGANTRLTCFLPFFEGIKTVHLLYDQDPAGDRAADRAIRGSGSLTGPEKIHVEDIKRVIWNPDWGKDVTDARHGLIPYMRMKHA